MEILCFAHHQEAQAFLESGQFNPVQGFFNSLLYEANDAALLITGEGCQQAAMSLAAALTRLPAVTKVINLGCTGSLAVARYPIGSVQKIRTAFGHGGGDYEFQSYSSNADASADCLSVAYRIDQNRRPPLHALQVAGLVDRELWGLAAVAKAFQKPWRAIKYVSDDAVAVDCAAIRQDAAAISERLRDFYLAEKSSQAPSSQGLNVGALPPGFHVTHSQSQRLAKFLVSAPERDVAAQISRLLAQEQSPKDRTRQLISWLEETANPTETAIKQQLAALWPKGLKGELRIPRAGSSLELTVNLRTMEDWTVASKALEANALPKALKVLHGEI